MCFRFVFIWVHVVHVFHFHNSICFATCLWNFLYKSNTLDHVWVSFRFVICFIYCGSMFTLFPFCVINLFSWIYVQLCLQINYVGECFQCFSDALGFCSCWFNCYMFFHCWKPVYVFCVFSFELCLRIDNVGQFVRLFTHVGSFVLVCSIAETQFCLSVF